MENDNQDNLVKKDNVPTSGGEPESQTQSAQNTNENFSATPTLPIVESFQHTPIEPTPTNNRRGGKKLLKSLVALVVIASLVVAGWYFTQQKSETQDQKQAANLREIDVLRIGTTEGPFGGIFPSDQGSGVSLNQSRQIYEGLVGGEDKKYAPLLARSWTNPDQKTWVFKLKQGVKFHTGKTMTANDVKASLDAIKELDFWSLSTDTIESVEVVNDNEVKITTTEPDSLLLNRLAFAYIFDTNAPDKNGGNNGTGPYRLTEGATETDTLSKLSAFDEYHQGKALARSIEYRLFNSEDEIVDAISKDEIDFTEIVASGSFGEAISSKGYQSQSYEAPGIFGLYMNIDKGGAQNPLKNIELRKALALAIDREALIKAIQADGEPAYQVIPKSLPGHDPELSFPTFNREAARKTLLAAYPRGVRLEYLYFEGVQPDAPIIIQQLKDAGFNIIPRPETDPNVITQKLRNGEYELFSASYSSDIYDSRDLLGGILGSQGTYAGYANDATFEKFLTDSDKEFDPTKRISVLRDANQYIADNLLWVPIRKTTYTAYYRDNLQIEVDYNDGSNLGVYYWKVGQKPN